MVSKAVVSLVALTALVSPRAYAASSAPGTSVAHHAATKVHAKPVAKSAGKAGGHSGHAPRKGEHAVERAVEKDPPKPSLTPLPTIAASMGTPLAAPISTDAKIDANGHGAEPGKSPDVHASPRKPLLISTHPGSKKGTTKPPCLRDETIVMRGTEEEKFALTKCDGSVAPLAVEQLSILVRPGSAAKPAAKIDDLAKAKGSDIAPGIRRIDTRLVERLQAMIDHFAKAGTASKIYVVSGYRPTSAGSFHATGRALDFRIEGVRNEELVSFCKTLPDTGCGYYPNSSFIHLDVRDGGTGHVSWIDASGPGEAPNYVASWPPPKNGEEGDPVHLLAKLGAELQILPQPEEHSGRADTGSKADLGAKLEEDPSVAMGRELNVEITP